MNVVFRFLLAAIFLGVGSLPESIASDISGIRHIEVTHSHADSDHHHDHELDDADHVHHHHEDSSSDVSETQVESAQHTADATDTHTHQLVLLGMQALVASTSDVFISIYQMVKFPFPRDLSVPTSHDLGSLFRPPISAA